MQACSALSSPSSGRSRQRGRVAGGVVGLGNGDWNWTGVAAAQRLSNELRPTRPALGVAPAFHSPHIPGLILARSSLPPPYSTLLEDG